MNKITELKMFKYKALLKNGRNVRGEIASYTEEEAKKELKARDIYVSSLTNNTPFYANWVNPSDLEKGMFFDKFSTQMETGADFQRILNNLKRDNFSFPMIKMLEEILLEIRKGVSFGDSLHNVNKFSSDTIEIIRAGEDSGKLIHVLKDLAELFSEKAAIRKTLKKAMKVLIKSDIRTAINNAQLHYSETGSYEGSSSSSNTAGVIVWFASTSARNFCVQVTDTSYGNFVSFDSTTGVGIEDGYCPGGAPA